MITHATPLDPGVRHMSDDSRLHKTTLRYLALGDSYTIGDGVAASEAWPAQLAQDLRDEGVAIADPQIVAQTGWTTDELQAAIDATPLDPPYDLVSLMVGVNDQYRNRPLDEYGEQFDALLQQAIGFAGGRAERVLVLSIPDWGVTPFALTEQDRTPADIGDAVDAFNVTAFEVCARKGVAFLDITPISRECGVHEEMLVADALHPSAAMHSLWAREALPAVRAMIQGE